MVVTAKGKVGRWELSNILHSDEHYRPTNGFNGWRLICGSLNQPPWHLQPPHLPAVQSASGQVRDRSGFRNSRLKRAPSTLAPDWRPDTLQLPGTPQNDPKAASFGIRDKNMNKF